MKITELLTKYNHREGRTDDIKYIVIHYVGATGSARANCEYYRTDGVGASAHYFVDFNGDVYRSVKDQDTAWHCGASKYVHPECRNANAIGIEMCVRCSGSKDNTSKDWYFEDETVAAAIELTKELMEKYGIDADHVIRHYDVTGKICPNPYVYNHTKHKWEDFKAAIANTPVKEKKVTVELPMLRKGSMGAVTITLQIILSGLGYDPNGIDGDFGPGCEKAVKAFQQDNNLDVDGIVGKNTWTALLY